MPHPQQPPSEGQFRDLSTLAEEALAPLLAEESALLWERLRWETGRGAEERQGLAWVAGEEVLGLLTLGSDGRVVMMGRLFASRRGPVAEMERTLLEAGILCADALGARDRICGDLLLLEPETRRWLQEAHPARVAERLLLALPSDRAPRTEAPLPGGWRLEPWEDALLEPAAGLLVAAYGKEGDPSGSLASTPEGAAQALARTVRHRDCGDFLPGASFLARDAASGRLEGLILACRMGPSQGHVAQVAVAPWVQGRGLGRSLVSRSLRAMAAQGCTAVHLAVDAGNAPALAVYGSLGFREVHRFTEFKIRT